MAGTGPAQCKPGSIRAKRKHRTTEGALGEMAPSTLGACPLLTPTQELLRLLGASGPRLLRGGGKARGKAIE